VIFSTLRMKKGQSRVWKGTYEQGDLSSSLISKSLEELITFRLEDIPILSGVILPNSTRKSEDNVAKKKRT